MDNKLEPTYDEWNKLYEAAMAFKSAACWEWMLNEDVFAVVNPENGEIAYCCIMGNEGEHFGVAGYLGQEGLNNLYDLLFGDLDDMDIILSQKCLMASFVDRTDLKKEDLKIIKELGLRFRGRNAWPAFRTYDPGKLPWFINAEQCRFLTHILTQSLEVALSCKKDKDILTALESGTILTRYCRDNDDKKEWAYRYTPIESSVHQYASFQLQDEIRLHRIKKIRANHNFTLEANTCFLPAQIKDKGQRPYFPKVCLYIDHENGLIISAEMLRDIKSEGYKFIEELLKFIEQTNIKPARIIVNRDETFYLLCDICDQIGIRLEKVEYLPFVEEFLEGMIERF